MDFDRLAAIPTPQSGTKDFGGWGEGNGFNCHIAPEICPVQISFRNSTFRSGKLIPHSCFHYFTLDMDGRAKDPVSSGCGNQQREKEKYF